MSIVAFRVDPNFQRRRDERRSFIDSAGGWSDNRRALCNRFYNIPKSRSATIHFRRSSGPAQLPSPIQPPLQRMVYNSINQRPRGGKAALRHVHNADRTSPGAHSSTVTAGIFKPSLADELGFWSRPGSRAPYRSLGTAPAPDLLIAPGADGNAGRSASPGLLSLALIITGRARNRSRCSTTWRRPAQFGVGCERAAERLGDVNVDGNAVQPAR